ncbi:GEVED domain-containing protein [Asanoa sp. NPDC049573]|uniref:GEVED domain-containing protein n=1 Tax=Asanoa sp. NPDC049573 TaxID=3155396 RepID=UPI00341AC099
MHRFVAAAALAAAAVLFPLVPASAAAPACVNGGYLVQDGDLLRLADRATVARFDAPLDAVAYVPGSRAFWAVSGDQVVSFDTSGRITRRAPLPDALRVTGPVAVAGSATSAGAGTADRWIVRTGRDVVTFRVPALKEVERHPLDGPGADILLRPRIADWDVDPADGRLYTVASGPPAQLLRIDPHTGRVTPVAAPKGLPQTGSFGAVTVDPQGTLHALHDPSGRLFDLDLAKPTIATPRTAGPRTQNRSDAAGCTDGWDYGDAPSPYPTRHAADGPRHRIADGLTLGTTADAEPDARTADKDDARPLAVRHRAGPLRVEVTVRNTTGHNALLAAWHDLDGNGRFDERDLATATVKPGGAARRVTLTWPKPRINATRSTVRIRLYGGPRGYRAPAPKPTGPADSGEVEDHLITVPAAAPDKAPLDIRNLAGPAVPDAGLPVPGVPATPLPAQPRRRHPVAITAPREPDGIPLTWSVFLGLLVPAASVAARAAAKRGSR